MTCIHSSPLVPPVPAGGRDTVAMFPEKKKRKHFGHSVPVIRRHRNAGDAHAAGAEHQRSPKERQTSENRGTGFPEKSRSGCKRKIRSRSIGINFSIAIMIAMKIFKARYAENISIKVCLKNFKQGPVAKSSAPVHLFRGITHDGWLHGCTSFQARSARKILLGVC